MGDVCAGLSTLPKYCLWMCLGWFLVGIGLNILRDMLPKRWAQFVPIPMAVAVVRFSSFMPSQTSLQALGHTGVLVQSGALHVKLR